VGIMMTYIVFILSIIFVISFVGFSSKPSPIYGGLVLIISGAVGCGIVLSFGGSFLGLIVFLIYLGGMLVVQSRVSTCHQSSSFIPCDFLGSALLDASALFFSQFPCLKSLCTGELDLLLRVSPGYSEDVSQGRSLI